MVLTFKIVFFKLGSVGILSGVLENLTFLGNIFQV